MITIAPSKHTRYAVEENELNDATSSTFQTGMLDGGCFMDSWSKLYSYPAAEEQRFVVMRKVKFQKSEYVV